MVVLDTSFLVAYHNRRDVHHAAAAPVMERLIAGELGLGLLPEYVFVETTTVLAARRNLTTAVRVADVLLAAAELELVPAAPLFDETYRVFRGQGRQGQSFADAAIVALCRQRGVSEVVSFDVGFRGVEGLTVLPEPRAS